MAKSSKQITKEIQELFKLLREFSDRVLVVKKKMAELSEERHKVSILEYDARRKAAEKQAADNKIKAKKAIEKAKEKEKRKK